MINSLLLFSPWLYCEEDAWSLVFFWPWFTENIICLSMINSKYHYIRGLAMVIKSKCNSMLRHSPILNLFSQSWRSMQLLPSNDAVLSKYHFPHVIINVLKAFYMFQNIYNNKMLHIFCEVWLTQIIWTGEILSRQLCWFRSKRPPSSPIKRVVITTG